MRLPANSVIAPEKATRYLLVPQARGDKSEFLALAGYTLHNAEQLFRDLRVQILPLEAVPSDSKKFGQYYEIRGWLSGPNGRRLAVRTGCTTGSASLLATSFSWWLRVSGMP